jgi:hypothetical protein
MGKAVVSESALRELLREALDNVGAMGLDAGAPVTPSAVVDRTSMELDFDPIEVKTLPRTRNELIVMVRNLLDTVDEDQSGELYKKIKAIVAGDVAGTKDFGKAKELPPGTNPVDRSTTTMTTKNESKNLVEAIRNIVEETLAEALPFGFGKGKMKLGGQFDHPMNDEEGPEEPDFRALGGSVDDDWKSDGTPNFNPDDDIIDPEEQMAALAKLTKSAWDPEDDADEDEAPVAPKGSPKKRVDLGTGYGVDGDTFEKIGEKMGFTPEAAKKAVATAMERFKVLHGMDPDDLEDMVLTGVDEYVDMLAKTGEMDDEEESFMRQHPEHVAASETFREFFSKYVKRAAREERADSQDDE